MLAAVTFSMVSMSPDMDRFLQNYAVAATLVLITILVAETLNPPSRVLLYAQLFAADLFAMIVVGAFFLPAEGKVAIGLHWQALLTTLVVLTVVLLGVLEYWLAHRIDRDYERDLETFKANQRYMQMTQDNYLQEKKKRQSGAEVIWWWVCSIVILLEVYLIFYLWLLK
jgi:hypothetical protein